MSEHHGMVWWTELMTRDLKSAVKYYGDVCGWSFDTMKMQDGDGDYYIGMKDGTPLVGLMDMTGLPGLDEIPPHWFSYFAVENVDAAVAATKAAGGQVRREPYEIPGIGRIAILADPTGAVMGLITPAARES